MMKQVCYILLHCALWLSTLGQQRVHAQSNAAIAPDARRYMISFTDKKSSPYSLAEPERFLSQRALARRKHHQIAVQERDLPVNPSYLKAVSATGAYVWYSSRWANAALVSANAAQLQQIKQLAFVKPKINLLSMKGQANAKPRDLPPAPAAKTDNLPLKIDTKEAYGMAYAQAQMLGVPEMHTQGHRGASIWIAVFDSGFENAHKVPFLAHLFDSGRIITTYDFVENQPNVYHTGSHGLNVLSTIAAYQPGKMIGTAPEAAFCLFRTEDTGSEQRIEEMNWLIAAERADSLGVDIINSSLGYTDFDYAHMNYSLSQLDGNTALSTRAADWAAQVGILVVNSAGNEGQNDWKYLAIPADADSILTVGAVTHRGDYAEFSSIGPTAKGRQKPNVVAMGSSATVGTPQGGFSYSSGTSFSAPIMAGFVASFWGANPHLRNMEVIEILQQSASQANKPDYILGYGIPNFAKAHALAQARKSAKPDAKPPLPKRD